MGKCNNIDIAPEISFLVLGTFNSWLQTLEMRAFKDMLLVLAAVVVIPGHTWCQNLSSKFTLITATNQTKLALILDSHSLTFFFFFCLACLSAS